MPRIRIRDPVFGIVGLQPSTTEFRGSSAQEIREKTKQAERNQRNRPEDHGVVERRFSMDPSRRWKDSCPEPRIEEPFRALLTCIQPE